MKKYANIACLWKPDLPYFNYLSEKLKSINSSLYYIDIDNLPQQETNKDMNVLYLSPNEAKYIPKLLEIYPNIDWIESQFAGVDTFLNYKSLLNERNIILSNAKGVFAPSLGEYVCAYILYWEKNLGKFHDTKKSKTWKKIPVSMLQGKTVGIIGYGNIGIEVAKRLKYGFDMNIIGLKSNLNKRQGEEYVNELIDNTRLDYLLSKSDYVIGILPKTSSTDGKFNASFFSKMKKDSIFINIGRGSSVIEEDLVYVLKNNLIRAASLDVTQIEPLPETSLLWELDNCYITNHSADCLNDGFDNKKIAMDMFYNRIKEEYLNGKVVSNLISLDQGY